MAESTPTFRVEKLSRKEIRLLRKRMVSVWLFGGGIGALAGYFIFGSSLFAAMRIPATIFSVFFFSILAFILFVHTRNAFQTEQRIYSGRITDKKTEASRMRNSQLSEEYYVALDGRWFRVGLQQFHQVHIDDEAEISTIGRGQVFKVEATKPAQAVLQEAPHAQKQTDLYAAFTDFSAQMTDNDKLVLRRKLRNAFIFRTLVGFFAGYILYYVLNVVLILSVYDNRHVNTYFWIGHSAIWILLVGIFALLNRKTIRLVRDLLSGEKKIVTEKITDRIRSNHLKPGPNSIIRGSYYMDDPKYFYIQTANHWLSVDESIFEQATVGGNLQIHVGARSRAVLQTEV